MPSEEKQWTMNRAGLVVKNLPGPVKLLVMLCLIVVGFNFLPSSSHRLNVGEEIVDTAIVVLGGGVAPDGDVPTHTRLRVDAAVNLYKSLNGQARVFPLSGGTPHKPNLLDAQGFPIWEAVAASRKLISLGIPPKHIYEEAFSLDTVGNAYWLRTVHIHPGKFRTVHVITNDWHLPRTQAIFTAVFALPDIDPHRNQEQEQLHRRRPSMMMRLLYHVLGMAGMEHAFVEPVQLHFHGVPAGIADPDILRLRQEKERKALYQFTTEVAPQWQSLHDLHTWLFTEHMAYSAQRHQATALSPSGKQKASSGSADPATVSKTLSKEESLLLQTY